jgi:hypothetical protein
MDAQYTPPTWREYELSDGTHVGGTMDIEVIEAMAGMKFTEPRSRASYRRAVARRTKQMYPGVELDTSTDEAFFADLIKHELLKEV